jgi:hypothetical protein
MLRTIASALLPCAALLTSAAALAQVGSRPDPAPHAATATTAVPPLTYESPFARYRAYAEQVLAPWRERNDTVGRIGGWRVYAREAALPAASPAPAGQSVPATSVPAAGGHVHRH